MKRSNIIYLGIIIVAIGIWYYLHAFTMLFHKNEIYYSYYDNVKGLQVSSPVYLKGVKVGYVEDIFVNDNRKVQANFSIRKDLKIPNGTIANITSGDLSGNKSVVLLFGTKPGYIQPGGELKSGIDSSMIENFNAKVTPILHHGKVLLKVADSGLSSFNGFILETFAKESKSSIATLNNNIDSIQQTSANAKKQVDGLLPAIHNFNKSTSSLKDNNSTLTQSIHNAENATEKLSKTDFKQQLEDFQSSTKKVADNIKSFKKNQILTNKKGVENLQQSIDTFHQSLKDYQNNPPALINILGSEKKQK